MGCENTREPAGWIRTNEGGGGTTQVISEYERIPGTLLMPQCQNCPRGGSLEQPPLTQDHISVFWCLLFVTEGQMNPPPSPPPTRTGLRAASAVTVVVFFSYIVSFFFFVSRDVDVAGLVTVESREREPFSWAFFFLFFFTCA